MRRVGHWVSAVFAMFWLATSHAWAKPSDVQAVIQVERAPGSEACPSSEAVFRSIEHLFPERAVRQSGDSSQSTVRAHVTIRPLAPGHEAVLTLLPPLQGERVIREADEDCRGLADALALAFVMLIAPDAETEPENVGLVPPSNAAGSSASAAAAGEPKQAEAQEIPQPVEPPRDLAREAPAYYAAVAASLVGGLGLLSKPALGAAGEVALFHWRGWGLSVAGVRLWSLPTEAEGGKVTLSLWGLLFAPCYQRRVTAASHLEACLRLGVGSQHAQVKGFIAPRSGDHPWMVLVPAVGYRQRFAELGEQLSGFLRVGLVAQLNPQSFSVRSADNAEQTVPVASSPDFGVMTEIGLVLGRDVF